MTQITIILTALQNIASCYDTVNKKVFGGKLTPWLVLRFKAIWAGIPIFVKHLKKHHSRHFRAMKKYTKKDIRTKRLLNKLQVPLYAYLSAVMYLVSALVATYTFGAFMTEFSFSSMSIGISAGIAFFIVAEFYRADAYNKAVESKMNLYPWNGRASL